MCAGCFPGLVRLRPFRLVSSAALLLAADRLGCFFPRDGFAATLLFLVLEFPFPTAAVGVVAPRFLSVTLSRPLAFGVADLAMSTRGFARGSEKVRTL